MVLTRIRYTLAAVGVTALSLLGPMAAAASASNPSSVTTGSFVCNTAASSSFNTAYASAKEYLPITRWSSVAGGDMHSRLSGGLLGLGSITGAVQRSLVESGSLTLGNALWRAGTGITDVSTRFCFANSVGYQADKMSASLGNAILSSGIIVLLVVIALAGMAWKAAKGSPRPFQKLFGMLATVGILGAMINGANATSNSNGTVVFGTLSPGWLITRAYSLMDTFASLPAAVIAKQSNGLTGLAGGNAGPLSCGQYEQNMLTAYSKSFGPGNSAQASLPLALDAMWEQTGLRTYINVQFGASNPYGGYTFCRLLDSEAGIPPLRQIANTKPSAPALVAKTNPSAPAWTSTGSTNVEVDTSLVGWAACRPNGTGWTVDPGWAVVTAPNGGSSTSGQISPSTCKSWWTSTNPNWAAGTALDWGANASNIQQGTGGQPQVANYLYNLHGNFQGPAIASAVTYAFASVTIFVVFMALGLAVIIAKVALLFLMMLLGLVAAMSLIPSSNGGSRLAGVGKHVLGMIIFSTGAQVLLALVALLTGELVLMSGTLAGTGSLLAILLTSFAPIAAIVILHFTFTKILKAPSPFRPTGALQYGKMASSGAIGGMAGAAIENRLSHRARQHARQAVSTGAKAAATRGKAAISKPNNRTGGMEASIPAAAGVAGARVGTGGWGSGGKADAGGQQGTLFNETPPATQATTDAGVWTTEAHNTARRLDTTPEDLRQRGAGLLDTAGVGDARQQLAQERLDRSNARAAAKKLRADANKGASVVAEARRITGNTRVRVAADRLRTHPVQTSVAAARTAARATKGVAKVGAVGAGVITLAAFGAVPAGIAVGAYGLHKANQARRSFQASAPGRKERWANLATAYEQSKKPENQIL